MKQLLSLIESTLADPLSAARGHSSAIAYVGFDFPLDIQLAVNRPCCHLPWLRHSSTPDADRWLESSFPGWARSILQQWIEGKFDIFSSVVFSRGDDASQRLYYYICELQRRGIVAGPKPLVLDVGCIARDTSSKHCERAIKKLMEELNIPSYELIAGITKANKRRTLFNEIESSRSSIGHLYENISRASLFTDLYKTLKDTEWQETTKLPRVLLAGSSPADDYIHRAIETIGWTVAGELHSRSLLRYGLPIDDINNNPIACLAKSINQNRFTIRSFYDRSTQLIETATRLNIDAVVLWITEEDESLAWHVANQKMALEKRGIRHLILTRRRWAGDDDSVETIQSFLSGLTSIKGQM